MQFKRQNGENGENAENAENGEIMLRQNPHGVRILIQVDIEITTNQDDVKSARCADFQSA